MDFYLYIGSTYTYLAVNRIPAIAECEGIELRWKLINARAIMIEQNNRPFVGKPVKLNYMWRDVERRAKRYGIPFTAIPSYPVDPEELANRVAVVASLEGWCEEYVTATYSAWFLENKAPGDEQHLRSLLPRLGKNAESTIERANSQEIRERYAFATSSAKEIGIFGSPTFVTEDGEIFWGDDRFEDAIEWCKAP
jgi:2-hydroxychromene-2-carboxylate isomerase